MISLPYTAIGASPKGAPDTQDGHIQKLLIVEDESLVAFDLQGRLETLGYEVCGIADTHDEAVLKAHALRPDLILMDIHLIGSKDGVQAAREIRKSQDIPIVFLTAHADNETIARIESAEPFGYVVKPFEEQELRATIEVALYRSKAERRQKEMESWLSSLNSQLVEAKEQLEFTVQHDRLTGCFNRNYLDIAFENVLTQVRTGHPAFLLSIDVDDFKIVNDIGGHLTGDKVLAACAHLIKASINNEDTLIRIGGDEFLVFLNDTNMNKACEIAERVRAQVEESSFCFKDYLLKVTLSVGVSKIDADSSQSQLIGRSDSACYSAKSRGRNCVVNHELLEVQSEPCNWKSKLDSAIDNDRLDLWFQPVIELRSKKAFMHEAFLRPKTQEGLVSNPAPYLRAAERYKIETEIDKHLINKTIDYLNRFPDKSVSINISAQSISSRFMGGFIKQAFKEYPGTPQRVCFEITETSLISDIEAASKFIKQLNEQGFTFALDNFGERCSPFYYLTSLPIQYIKIDGRYIVGLEKEPANQLIVQGINSIAHDLNIRSIAEHVESADALQLLMAIGIDFAQGYYLGHPIPWREINLEPKRPNTTSL